VDDIDALLYKPGSFVCPKCGFVLEVRSISVSTGQIGIRKDGEEADPCPNDGEMMNRVTWKDAYLNIADSEHELMLALIESVKLQSHYAELLNDHDAGNRAKFLSGRMDRAVEAVRDDSPGQRWASRYLRISATTTAAFARIIASAIACSISQTAPARPVRRHPD